MNNDTTKSIRENYDRVADEYARKVFDELRHKPLDRALLNRFAQATAGGEVCDMGCGPGHVARHLRDAGANVFGLDLSAEMVKQARQLNPDIAFREGNMLSLDLAEASLAGITAFYAIVNFREESLPQIFQEMVRVLEPNGLLLLAFHAGDEVVTPEEMWGRPFSLNFFFFHPSQIRKRLEEAGFIIEEIIERDPHPEIEYQSRRAYIFAHKPNTSSAHHG